MLPTAWVRSKAETWESKNAKRWTRSRGRLLWPWIWRCCWPRGRCSRWCGGWGPGAAPGRAARSATTLAGAPPPLSSSTPPPLTPPQRHPAAPSAPSPNPFRPSFPPPPKIQTLISFRLPPLWLMKHSSRRKDQEDISEQSTLLLRSHSITYSLGGGDLGIRCRGMWRSSPPL